MVFLYICIYNIIYISYILYILYIYHILYITYIYIYFILCIIYYIVYINSGICIYKYKCDLLQEKGPSSFAFPTAFRRFQLSLTAFKRFCYINTLLKLGSMRFVYSHSFVSVNRVCTTFILILL